MIIVMQRGTAPAQVQTIVERVQELGFQAHLSVGEERTIIGVIGDERYLNENNFILLPGVEKVVRILSPYKLAGRDFHPNDTTITIDGHTIGANQVTVMAGPCAVESWDQLLETAKAVAAAGVHVLRAGAFKPRTSPYSFQGLGEKALEMLAAVREETGLLVLTEVMAPEQVGLVAKYADILQVGTRNMQNYNLLHAVGECNKPVLLKRGMMSTMEELLMSAEYILSHGNYQVMLCERGIRTFETFTRSTLDLSAVPVLKQITHLPVLVDPSHAAGKAAWVPALSLAAIAAGADGLLIEVHPHPEQALSDGPQSLRPADFTSLVGRARLVAQSIGRTL